MSAKLMEQASGKMASVDMVGVQPVARRQAGSATASKSKPRRQDDGANNINRAHERLAPASNSSGAPSCCLLCAKSSPTKAAKPSHLDPCSARLDNNNSGRHTSRPMSMQMSLAPAHDGHLEVSLPTSRQRKTETACQYRLHEARKPCSQQHSTATRNYDKTTLASKTETTTTITGQQATSGNRRHSAGRSLASIMPDHPPPTAAATAKSSNKLGTTSLAKQTPLKSKPVIAASGSSSETDDCAKCQLIVEWTLAQAARAQQQHRRQLQQQQVRKGSKQLQLELPLSVARAITTSELKNPKSARQPSGHLKASDQCACNHSDLDDVSSLTDSCESALSLSASSSFASSILATKRLHSERQQWPSKQMQQVDLQTARQRKLSLSSCDIRPNNCNALNRCHYNNNNNSKPARIVCEPSGNFEVIQEANMKVALHEEATANGCKQATRQRKQAAPPPPVLSIKTKQQQAGGRQNKPAESSLATNRSHEEPPPKASDMMLREPELVLLEHSLKSLKSSVYVAGCLADFYLTKTSLVDNGRRSQAQPGGWRLKQTGVPILTFDSGLARNRQRRQLRLNLAERESGLVLWSDTINHLSGYRRAADFETPSEPSCRPDCFHQMYVSSDHRVLAGLAFYDSTCARLFLAQVELVTSDPRNISLSGPKHHPKSSSASSASLSCSSDFKAKFWAKLVARPPGVTSLGKRAKSISSLEAASQAASNNYNNYSAIPDRANTCKNNMNEARYLMAFDYSRLPTGTWSTLKRAIKRASIATTTTTSQVNKTDNNSSQAAIDICGQQGENIPPFSEQQLQLIALFRPRPLPALAAAGKSYRSARKMPRKCDISAPCLFQHVGRVSASQLMAIESSLSSESDSLTSPTARPTTSGDGIDHEASQTSSSDNKKTSPISNNNIDSVASQKHNASSSLGSTSGFTSCSISESSSVSYSSAADHSDSAVAASEPSNGSASGSANYDNSGKTTSTSQLAQLASRQATANMRLVGQPARAAILSRAPRPPPPPVRVPELHQPKALSSSNPAHATSGVQSISGAIDSRLATETKIQAMIRELESQASAEMVTAKRELMADIAGQLKNTGIQLKSVQIKGQKPISADNYHDDNEDTTNRMSRL